MSLSSSYFYKSLGLFCFVLQLACQKDTPTYTLLQAEQKEEQSGGATTVFDISENAFGFQAANLNADQELFFFVGNSLFNQNWVSSPASTTARDGLGPLFNARSCSGCHFKDGRGRPPAFSGEINHGLLLRLSQGETPEGDAIAAPFYKTQLQDQANLGITPEGKVGVNYQEITGTYPDGNTYSLQKPTYYIQNPAAAIKDNLKISPRVANHMVGLGLLEAIDKTQLLAFADPEDTNQDGISGRVNYVWDIEKQDYSIGRFGWKANQPNLKQQVAAAFSGDMGITSSLFLEENFPPHIDCSKIAHGGSPEISDQNLEHVVLYSSTLAVPARRDWQEQEVLQGKLLFEKANCSACHIPKITTGTHASIQALSDQVIRPYTDMLLHDMGPDLSDNRPDFLAQPQEWRTAPLWGIGLVKTVNNHTRFLHDGRARNLEEAILWHGGEAENAKNNFKNLTKTQREQLLSFLASL